MKICVISDSHTQHKGLDLKPYFDCDTIIHAGDISNRGSVIDCQDFLSWYSALPFKNKILIAGNHDFLFENDRELALSLIPDNIIYLEDQGIEIDGIKFWGSPVQPYFYNWAFNKRGEEIIPFWDKIPDDTDVLITHGPAKGILDECINDGYRAGCPYLLKRIKEIKPKFHLSGHIHEGYGIETHGETTFINASVLNERYRLVNKPIIFEI